MEKGLQNRTGYRDADNNYVPRSSKLRPAILSIYLKELALSLVSERVVTLLVDGC